MTTALIVIAVWIPVSAGVALLLARMFRSSSPLVTAPGGEVASPVTDYVTAHVVAGDASNFPTPTVGDGPPE